jgi:HPt (histidine-containing phosphotransfer) domain-containing protein
MMLRKKGRSGAMQAVRISAMAQAPIDLDHLTRQTLGDPAVQREVLELFLREMEAARCKLAAPQNPERAELAHRIKGAASGVGATSLAASAAALEAEPDRIELAAALLVRMHEAVCFIAERGLR